MTLRTRIILTIGGVALLLALPALYAARQLDRLREFAQNTSSTHGAAYLAMGRLQAHLADLDRLERAYVAVPDAQGATRRDLSLGEAERQVEALTGAGYEDMSADARAHVERLRTEIGNIDGMIAAGDTDGATARLESLKPLFAADSIIQTIASEIDRRSERELTAAGTISAAALTTTLLALAACLFIAVLLGAWATQTVVRPLHRLRRGMAAVAAGEFAVPEGLVYEKKDEIGDLARSFRSMTLKLRELDRVKADFMSIATHELKTPINVISGYTELIQEGVYGEPTPKQQDALRSIQEQSRVLTLLVNQLLDVSRLEAGGMRLEITDVSVSDLFERVRRTFEVLARKEQLELQVELDASAPAIIPADGDRLRDQVLGNLLANALKFTPAGGIIRVRVSADPEHCYIEVSDTGTGMPADQLPHVFDKYFQIGEQARSKGAGLGLTIAHDIVQAHGGTIEVSSTEGVGTTFRIALPRQGARVEPARPAHVVGARAG